MDLLSLPKTIWDAIDKRARRDQIDEQLKGGG
jgi:hypothetical protein